ncbi:hypothetical protein GOP47_0011499 [Adiantum capillus-veneris]|uniref:RZ-type domain-containing protein n=1 Tax=Adiantum capillus-veneris TaxID=13818 RepID=A0A9D4UTE4_ADICA|nr:hypothetical protein GOP47_0011499 [Adiantum capillus-veneris]
MDIEVPNENVGVVVEMETDALAIVNQETAVSGENDLQVLCAKEEVESHEELELNKAPASETSITQLAIEGPIHEVVSDAAPHLVLSDHRVFSLVSEQVSSRQMITDGQGYDEDAFEAVDIMAAHDEAEDAKHMRSWFMMDVKEAGVQELARFCLLVSPAPTALNASVYDKRGELLGTIGFQKLELPKRSEVFMGTYTCWQIFIPKYSAAVDVIATFPRSGILSMLKASFFGSNEVEEDQHFYLRSKRLQIDIFHGPSNASDKESSMRHMAFYTILVLLNHPDVMRVCSLEYRYFITRAPLSSKAAFLMLKKALPWLEWIQQKLKMGLTESGWDMEWAFKMILAFLSQIQLLRHLQRESAPLDFLGRQLQLLRPNTRREEVLQDLMKRQYEALLTLFSKIYSIIGPLEELPDLVKAEFSNAASELVDFTPAVKWSSYLDALCLADPSYSFIEKWKNKRKQKDRSEYLPLEAQHEDHVNVYFSRTDTTQAEKDYEEALSRVLKFANDHPDKSFKDKAIRAAILAAPSALTLLNSIGFLSANNVVSGAATVEEVEAFLSSKYGNTLTNLFEWLTELESPQKMALLLLQAFCNTNSKSMLGVLRIFTSNFVQNQLMRTRSSGSTDDGWIYLEDVVACPNVLVVPLLHTESIMINVLVERGPVDLAAHVMLKLSRQVDALQDEDENRGLIVNSLRVWLQQTCANARRTVSQAPAGVTPCTMYTLVSELFGEGLKPGGYLDIALSEIIPSILQQLCAVETIIQDAAMMSSLQSQVIVAQYHVFARDILLKYLMSNNENNDLDTRAEQLLQWLFLSQNNQAGLASKSVLLNGWVQQDLCITLLDTLVEQGYNSSLSIEKLVDSNFVLTLLQIEQISEKVKENLLYVSASRAWTELQQQLESGTVKVEVISKLLSYPQVSWEKICKEQNVEGANFEASTKLVVDYLNIQMNGFQMLLDYARHFEGHRCSGEVLQRWQSWMQERSQDCKHFTLNKIQETDHWPIQLTVQYLSALLILKDSKILGNIFKEKESHTPIQHIGNTTILAAADSPGLKHTLWTSVASLLEVSLVGYREEWRNLAMPDYPVDRLNILLEGVNQEVLGFEANQAEAYFNFIQEPLKSDIRSYESALNSWMNFLNKRSLKDPLLKIMSKMKLVEDEDLLLKSLLSLQTIGISGTLGDFLEMYKMNTSVIDFFNSKEIEVLKQLAESEQLIRFLKENTDEDLRMLTDAIEEQAEDAVVDEVIVSDLIHVDKLLRPLLQSPKFTIVELKSTIAKEVSEPLGATELSEKLNYCNANIHRIRHFVASLADRSSVLKNHMFKIMESGVHTFVLQSQSSVTNGDVCKFTVLCGGTQDSSSRQQFTMTDLKDLRSRARMLLSMRRIKRDVLANQVQSSNTTGGQRPNMAEALMEFVEHVNLAEKLLEQLNDVQKSGHLLFDEVEWSIHGLRCLKERVQWMDGQIACWHTALQKARNDYNCLNFFKGTELRLFYQCFIGQASYNQFQICWELLEWAKPGLDRKAVETCQQRCTFNKIEMDFNQTNRAIGELRLNKCLNCLGIAINFIFALKNMSKQPPPTQGTSMFDQDAIYLVSVEDQQRELNVVVEIFHKHYGDLGKIATNLLLCSSTTSWEDIHLMILRFLASDNESDVFVIAYINKLTFECQSQLTERLQQLSAATLKKLTRHRLSLVCSTKTQALHGISHHLKVPIQLMDGIEIANMIHQLPTNCQEMRVVTSELSGMGKSRYIKTQGNGLCAILPIAGEVTHDYLILKLKMLLRSTSRSLHLDITTEKDSDNLNVLLFELLICGTLKSSSCGVYRLGTTKVYVELANTLGNLLEASLFICSWLPQQHLKWDLSAWQISKNLDSDDQVVCVYLDKLAKDELNKQDIVLSGKSKKVVALPEPRCRELMQLYFIKDSTQMSYTVLAGFIRTFAYQLRRFGANDFCKCETLHWILRDNSNTGNFRSIVVESLLQAARDLSLRSVKPWLHEEQKHIVTQDISKSMHERTRTMLRWSESNHVMIFFDANGLIRILYRDKKLIPPGIENILSIQVKVLQMQLPDYSALSSEELWKILWPILCTNDGGFAPNYVLTPDNFLKMALVSLRINTRVPVIIMGETGCGKTSLLRALATFSSASFSCLTLHAGSTIQDIELFINNAEAQALSSNAEVWAFLDEINACPHLGFLNSILCHHTLSGRFLHPKLVVLAACNPYRLIDTEGESSGLQMKNLNRRNKQELAYTVHPLPEAMLDHVWDYGILSDSDERAYISAMIGNRRADIVDLISNSQKFMREHLALASVSLRDVQRWICLYDWFRSDISLRLGIKEELKGSKFVDRRAKVLACSLCYHCRFPGKDSRRQYRERCCSFLSPSTTNPLSQAKFLKILHEEQRDILSRMEIPPGIAINSSLLENVFVVLVCLLNYIPVFVVGKPGSGKTLALHIIYSNLRGTDSKDEYFRKLPRILFLSYQGSQNSTSEGILKVFDKAKRYVHSNKERDILVVVVLDEVGLAETSHHNPLKVLHPLLEPDVREIAVVGISNWSLDAAKMNRGVHLSQSDPGIDDLYQTSIAIFESYESTSGLFLSDTLRRLAAAYHKYHAQQSRADFHGLRDFYSLVKSLRLCSILLSPSELAHSLWRNFGGASPEDMRSLFHYLGGITEADSVWDHPPSVMDLIQENLQDPEARHLMLITKGDSASNILQHILEEDEDFVVIRGSTYQDDKNEEYCYLMLSDIILYMEMGRHVLLENADQIWTSLYDMLNQHYSYVGGRRNCRIALGAYSNPMCFVHNNFRCIVVVEEDQVPNMDPPFLNRFEKQCLTYEGILNESQRKVVESIRDWAQKLASMGCNTSNVESPENHMFAGYYQDSVPSLVMLHSSKLHGQANSDSQPGEDIISIHSKLIERCKKDLLQTAYVDAIARAYLSLDKVHADSDVGKYRHWTEMFLTAKFLHSLKDSIEENIADTTGWIDSIGMKLIITTCTPVQWSIQQDMEGVAAGSDKYTFMRLGDFTSERQLQSHIQKFWCDDHSSMLILQADDALDKDHISLAKFHVDRSRKTFQEVATTNKHVVIIVHVQQGVGRRSNFSFLCGWKQLTLHRLQKEPIAMRDYLEQSMRQIIDHEAMPIKHIMARVLTWSYLCIKYEDPNITALYPQQVVQSICEDEALMTCIKERALVWVLSRGESLWQSTVLNNQKLLSTSASVHDAFVQYIEERFREAVARIVYLVEKASSLKAYFTYDAERKHTWRQVFMLPESLKCDTAPAPCYPEGYSIPRPLDLSLPFSSLYAAHLDKTFRALYLEKFFKNHNQQGAFNDDSLINNSIQKDVDASLSPMLSVIQTSILWDVDSYIEDFAKTNAANLIENKRVLKNLSSIDATRMIENNLAGFQALEWILRENLRSTIQHPSDVHVLCWEREPELKAQVSMALLCMPLQEIKEEVAALKAGRTPIHNFSEEFSIRCSTILLPTKSCVDDAGGIQSWLHNSQALTSLLPPLGSSVLLFMLQSLQNLAAFVIIPLRRRGGYKILVRLADWFQKNLKEANFVLTLREIVNCVPNINKLDNSEAKYWLDFLCAVLKQYPELADLPKSDLVQIFSILMSSSTPSCMMGPIMLQLLSSYLSTIRNFYHKKAPVVMVLLSNTTDALMNKEWDTKAAGSIVLSDQLYHYMRQTIMPALLGGISTNLWNYSAFDECLCLATKLCEDEGSFTLRKMAALALWKSFLYSAAYLLTQVKTKVKDDKHSCKLVFSPAFLKALSSMSSILKYASQTFFMKVLYQDVGLSTGDIQELLPFCESQKHLTSMIFFLDHPLMRNTSNRLGFNPFSSSSKFYVAAERALRLVLPENEGLTFQRPGQEDPEDFMSKKSQEELGKFIREATHQQQIMFVTVMASELFVMKSGAQLSKAEWAAMEWLKETVRNERWDSLLQHALTHIFTKEKGGLWHSKKNLSTRDLELRCLMLDVLLKVAALPEGSPLRGYCMLAASHFRGAHVLTDADSILQKVDGLGPYREYVCPCGFVYIVGNCTLPMQTSKCPNCSQKIGGTDHKLLPGQVPLKDSGNTGRIVGRSVVGNRHFSLRIGRKSYRLLRVLVYSCFLIGAVCNGDLTELSAFMQLQNEKRSLVKALKKLIEDDMSLLGPLIDCQYTVTLKYIHSILELFFQLPSKGPLKTLQERDNWEVSFERIIEKQPVQETISEYLKVRGTDGLNNLLMEESPCPPASLQAYFRITKNPCLSDFETKFVQSKQRVIEHPCIAAVLVHRKALKSLAFLLPIVRFCASLRQALEHNITRHLAATKSIQSVLQERSELADLYDKFEWSWNSVRLEVHGFECRQFTLPEMHKDQPIALCLLEKKDQGIFITAIFELLRTQQNDFLQEVEATLAAGSLVQPEHGIETSMLSVPVQLCKADQIVSYEDSWLNDLVSELGMCKQTYGHGINIVYDDVQIEHQLFHRLVQGKPMLEGEYVEFAYQQESFQRHATLISDVREVVPQETLLTEKLANISRELALGALGAGQILANLELCLGFLRKTKADSSEPLRDYCKRWLDNEAHPFFAKVVFDGVQVKHVVSLYEGLEESASSAVEELVTSRYRSKLDAEAREDLKRYVVVKKSGGAVGRVASSSNEKLGAEAFRDVLRQFMFRYLTADTFKPEEELSFYLINPQLVTWPAWDVDPDTLEDIFPSSFKLKHSRALYIALKEMC